MGFKVTQEMGESLGLLKKLVNSPTSAKPIFYPVSTRFVKQ